MRNKKEEQKIPITDRAGKRHSDHGSNLKAGKDRAKLIETAQKMYNRTAKPKQGETVKQKKMREKKHQEFGAFLDRHTSKNGPVSQAGGWKDQKRIAANKRRAERRTAQARADIAAAGRAFMDGVRKGMK